MGNTDKQEPRGCPSPTPSTPLPRAGPKPPREQGCTWWWWWGSMGTIPCHGVSKTVHFQTTRPCGKATSTAPPSWLQLPVLGDGPRREPRQSSRLAAWPCQCPALPQEAVSSALRGLSGTRTHLRSRFRRCVYSLCFCLPVGSQEVTVRVDMTPDHRGAEQVGLMFRRSQQDPPGPEPAAGFGVFPAEPVAGSPGIEGTLGDRGHQTGLPLELGTITQ